jgi:hypothetical protein
MAFPIILYRNIFRTAGAVLTSSGDDAGYSPGGVADHKTYGTNAWQGNVLTSPQYVNLDALAPVTADSILIVNGNIVSNAGQVKVYADTVNPPVAVAQALYSPTSDFADYKSFSALTKRYWRVEVSDPAPPFTTKPFLGEVLLGSKLTMTEFVGPDSPPRPYMVAMRGSRSDGGHYLGASLQGVARRGTLRFGGKAGVARTQFTSDLIDFLENHYKKGLPWGFILDTDDSEYAAVRWYKAPDNVRSDNLPVGGVYARQTFDLPFEEAMMETVA